MLLLILFLYQSDAVQLVRSNALTGVYEWKSVAEGLEQYRWFKSFEWREEGKVVIFRGEINDVEATKAFEDRYKYTLHTSMKAIQLAPNYNLDEDKDMLSFTIQFQVSEAGDAFKVKGGSLGVRSTKSGEWREKALNNKALVEVIKGCYRQRNPYMSLIEGLPFK